MRKLTLKLDDLAVESFSTQGPAALRGTVIGHDETTGPVILCSCAPTPQPTQYLSCGGTCDDSCNYGTCDATCACTQDYRCGDTMPGQIVCA